MDVARTHVLKPLELSFLAEPEEVPALRRVVRQHLEYWGMADLVDAAQLCVSELVTNVLIHVGVGTPTTLVLRIRGSHLRIEVQDPDPRALPTLVAADLQSETGRGLGLLDATADRWGIIPTPSGKTTWAEVATISKPQAGYEVSGHIAWIEPVIRQYRQVAEPCTSGSVLSRVMTGDAGTHLIADVLHWLHVRGFDADETLDHAQSRFEAERPAER
ncbi:ATP-binding protein [Streptomyces sp. ISL-43]|uniref:ATP-binding protein n=1 Tax=Streptomyces sp. ISL-43 TaxID=2819183 RepID=UPI001BE77844|nr:ATP-binding protein [Streptomyces sp. ISL-43]MBT2449366.1 ATP-binding protein [Streptomyces sp. ISL-43]